MSINLKSMLNILSHGKFFLLSIIALTPSAVSYCETSLDNIYWTGIITSVSTYADNAVPVGVFSGAPIHGVHSLDPSASTHLSHMLGNVASGEVYRFTSGLTETISIGSNIWKITGGNLTFSLYYDIMDLPGRLAYDIFSTSDTATHMSIPKDAGYSEVGFAFFDETMPYGLFDHNTGGVRTPNLAAITSASGFISSRHFDSQGNLIDGYYINFDITSASLTPIPEPSVFASALGGIALAYVCWRRFRGSTVSKNQI